MKTLITILCGAFFILCLSSCFEITEEVAMNADGSGKVTLTINLSESKRSLVNYMKVGSVDGMAVPSRREIEEKLDAILYTLQKTKGLSEVIIKRNFDDFIFVCSSEFANVAALNKAINEIADLLNESHYPTIRTTQFDYSDRQFARRFKYPLKPETYTNAKLSTRYMMDTARMISIFRLPQAVKKISNEDALLSPSKKSVMLQASLAELIKGEVKLDNIISF